jgi:hypothetical protein
MRQIRCRGTRPVVRAALLLYTAGPSVARAHLHGRSHLGRGGAPRCGCGPVMPVEETSRGSSRADCADAPVLNRQRHAYVRTHFIYSDRMARAVR